MRSQFPKEFRQLFSILPEVGTEERKQWLEYIKQWQLKKDAQCIRIHGYGWHYDIDADTSVKD